MTGSDGRLGPEGTERLRTLALLLDRAIRIPGTRIRIGLDPILGLLPGLGDALAVGLSGYLIVQAARAGAPRGLLLRMLWNVAVDAIVGSVPLVGDVFDVAWAANVKNVELLERQLVDPMGAVRAGRHFVALVVAALGLLAVTATALVALLVALLIRLAAA